jgi:predicted TIM-barrel fold metal-dependent hydrolase|eukprot:COSAG02_NODE_2355_length_9073_cov_3.811901_1_plen_316_part_00
MHFWSFRTHCWLHDITEETEIAGLKFKPLAIDYGPAEFQAEAEESEFEIIACVHIEASADHPDFNAVGEARWLQAMGDVSPVGKGMPQAIVPFAPMGNFAQAEAVLRDHCSLPNVKGIRFNLDHHPTREELRQTQRDDWFTDEQWLRSLAVIDELGLSFDLQIHIPQMPAAAQLANEFPDVQFLLNHAGFPYVTDNATLGAWHDGMERLAACSNVACKISGLGMADYDDAHFVSVRGKSSDEIEESIRPFVLDTIDAFGANRCMLASNFPVDKLMCSWTDLYRAYTNILDSACFTEEEKDQLFRGNAVKYYDLDI